MALAKDSALARMYLMQLAKVDYHNPCLTCLRVAEEQIGFILSSMPSKINDREVRGFIDFTYLQPNKVFLERLVSLDTYALSGETLLCEGLNKQDSALLMSAYAHFALSGLNVRATNTLKRDKGLSICKNLSSKINKLVKCYPLGFFILRYIHCEQEFIKTLSLVITCGFMEQKCKLVALLMALNTSSLPNDCKETYAND